MMPLASMSKADLDLRTHAGPAADRVSSNIPSFLLYAAISRSPW